MEILRRTPQHLLVFRNLLTLFFLVAIVYVSTLVMVFTVLELKLFNFTTQFDSAYIGQQSLEEEVLHLKWSFFW